MLTLPPSTRIFLATSRVDGRKGIDGLAALLRAQFAQDPLSGHLFVFFSRRVDRVRVLYFDHGGYVLITNNEVERDLRTWVLDRKTWLFCGHEQSAMRAAAAMTVLVTCGKLGIDPRRYVRDVVRALLACETQLAKLLPENYVPSG